MDGFFPKINSTEFTEKLLVTYFQNDHKHFDMIRNFIVTLQESLEPGQVYTSEESDTESSSDSEWEDVASEDEIEPGMEDLSNIPEKDSRDTIAFTDMRRVDGIVLFQFVRNLYNCTYHDAFISFNSFHDTLFTQ